MSKDSYYTPKILAEKLVSFAKKENIESVVDFCVGDGELLRAASEKWPMIDCFGSDVSQKAIATVKARHKDWKVWKMDFLDENLRNKSRYLKKQGKFDLILLNPPFSCIGGLVHEINFEGKSYSVSTAMRFLITSLNFLKEDGAIYAILPTSIAYSQKDSKLWSYLETHYNLSVLEEPKGKYFNDCTPNILVISLNDFTKVTKLRAIPRIPLSLDKLSIFRGKLSMCDVLKYPGNDLLIHSTNIRNNSLNDLKIKVNRRNSVISGPALLMSRVGRPLPNKMCIISEDESYTLSDCVIAIKTNSLHDASRLQLYMTNNWSLIEEMYTGTGARYITIEKLNQFLNLDCNNLDFMVSKVV